jgi:hypothetical protein
VSPFGLRRSSAPSVDPEAVHEVRRRRAQLHRPHRCCRSEEGLAEEGCAPLAEIAGNEEALCCTDGALELGEDHFGIELKNPDELEEAR